jgi:hypothetical protein
VVRSHADPFGMGQSLEEMEQRAWTVRITAPSGNKKGVDGVRKLRAVVETATGREYYSEPFFLDEDQSADEG